MRSIRFCVNCDMETSHHFALTNYDSVSATSFDILRCERCELVSTKFDAPHDLLTKFYPEDYREYSGIKRIIQKLIYWNLIRKWVTEYRPASVFEVGFGKGEMLSLLKNRGINVSGCEMKQSQIERIWKSAGVVSYVELDRVPEDEYDLIILYNSLEHLSLVDQYLRFVKNRLDNNGTVIITVPNFKSMQCRILKERWVHLDAPRHLTHFTRDTLCQLMSKYDFEIVKSIRGSIVYDVYGWAEGFKSSQLTVGLKSTFLRSILQFLISIVFGLFAVTVTLLVRCLGDSALIEAHFRHKKGEK